MSREQFLATVTLMNHTSEARGYCKLQNKESSVLYEPMLQKFQDIFKR